MTDDELTQEEIGDCCKSFEEILAGEGHCFDKEEDLFKFLDSDEGYEWLDYAFDKYNVIYDKKNMKFYFINEETKRDIINSLTMPREIVVVAKGGWE